MARRVLISQQEADQRWQVIQATLERRGWTPDQIGGARATRQAESGGGRDLHGDIADGDFQFVRTTWNEMVAKVSARGGADAQAIRRGPMDPEAAALAFDQFRTGNRAIIARAMGKDPSEVTAVEDHMAHFMGAGGASRALALSDAQRRTTPMSAFMSPDAVRHNQEIAGKTVEQAMNYFSGRMREAGTVDFAVTNSFLNPRTETQVSAVMDDFRAAGGRYAERTSEIERGLAGDSRARATALTKMQQLNRDILADAGLGNASRDVPNTLVHYAANFGAEAARQIGRTDPNQARPVAEVGVSEAEFRAYQQENGRVLNAAAIDRLPEDQRAAVREAMAKGHGEATTKDLATLAGARGSVHDREIRQQQERNTRGVRRDRHGNPVAEDQEHATGQNSLLESMLSGGAAGGSLGMAILMLIVAMVMPEGMMEKLMGGQGRQGNSTPAPAAPAPSQPASQPPAAPAAAQPAAPGSAPAAPASPAPAPAAAQPAPANPAPSEPLERRSSLNPEQNFAALLQGEAGLSLASVSGGSNLASGQFVDGQRFSAAREAAPKLARPGGGSSLA